MEAKSSSWCWCVEYLTWIHFIDFNNVDIIMISQHSYFLYQQHDSQPFSSAAKKYKGSDSHGRVKKALEEVFRQYGKASHDQKVEMITNVILQNHMYVFNISSSILSAKISI